MWILLSVSSSLIWSGINVFDKFIISKIIKTPIIPIVLSAIVGVFIAFVVFISKGFDQVDFGDQILCLVCGALYVLMAWFYFVGMKNGEVSRLIPIFYISPIFVAILSYFVFDEVLGLLQYIGVILLILGAISISTKSFKRITIGKPAVLFILSTIFWSAYQVVLKHLLDNYDYWTIYSLVRLGVFIATVPIVIIKWKSIIEMFNTVGKKFIGLITVSESINLIGTIFATIAISMASVVLVTALTSLQPFFVLVIASLVSIFYPKILEEKLNRKIITQKLIAILIMFVGFMMVI